MDLAIMIEGQDGLNWERWKRIAQATEELGFAGLYRSDHFTNSAPPELDSLELWISLTYLATHTKRIEFGPLVTPFSFRHPSITARMATAVDDLSNGRLQLGLGAGWNRREHQMFGFDLLDEKRRMQRLEEGLQIITKLFNSNQPFSFPGKFFQLKEAVLMPRPTKPSGPPIVLGGNGLHRTLSLAAKYADEWNGTSQTPLSFQKRMQLLDKHLENQGRKPESLRRTAMQGVAFGRTKTELELKISHYSRTKEELIANGKLVGNASEIVDQLAALAEVGCHRVMLQWLDQDDIDGLEALAKDVLPHFQ